MLTGIIGFILGAIAIGFLANRKPEWFARVVRVANDFDAKVNAGAAQVAAKAQS